MCDTTARTVILGYRRDDKVLKKEPIRHHYIPQFILRNFCDNKGFMHYYSKEDNELILRKPKNIFMVRNLYRDEINYTDCSTKIEKDLGRFESEVSQIVRDKLLMGDAITLARG